MAWSNKGLSLTGFFKDIDSYADQHGFPRQDYGHAGLIVIDPFTTQQNRIKIYSDIEYGANILKLMNDDYRKKGVIKWLH